MFTDKSFPHFFRVVPSDNEFNPPRLSIMRNFNWTRVGTLYQNEAKYALVSIFDMDTIAPRKSGYYGMYNVNSILILISIEINIRLRYGA